MMKEKKKTNWVLTIVLILGTVTVFFPLYMAVIIAFKKPSEMTNDVAGMFVPFSILMMPLVKQTAHMGLGNRAGVILLYLVFYMPMNVLLYSGYLKNIPIALEEAADIDGASTWTTYWKVVFPMMMPMHATVAILTALGTWNDVMTPLVIMSGTGQNTLPLAQLNFQTQFGTNYNLAFASCIRCIQLIRCRSIHWDICCICTMELKQTAPWIMF